MGIQEHEVRTKTDQLIAAVEALSVQIVTLQTAMVSIQAQISDVDRRVDASSSRYGVHLIDGYVHKIVIDEVATTA
jgi:hypothetical protein